MVVVLAAAVVVVVVVVVAGRVCCLQCNNPKTKEPKLDAAMRIIPEWNDRDAEIRRLWDSVYTSIDTSSSSTSSSGSDLREYIIA